VTGILLDTSAYSALMRGHPLVKQGLREASDVCMSVVVLGELRSGFRKGTRPAENEARLQEFLATPRVRVLPVDEETSVRYAVIRVDLERRDKALSLNDIWIAATAFQHGLRVLTTDPDFRRPRRVLTRPAAHVPSKHGDGPAQVRS
jgi:tRNA(fMet)-specific endonuclease VapC